VPWCSDPEHEATGATGAVHKCSDMSAKQYLKLVIETIETTRGETLEHNKDTTTIPSYSHPEIDETDDLGDDDAKYYRSLMGILQWVVELGRIGVAYAAYEVHLLASYSCAPRKGHLEATMTSRNRSSSSWY
jgi:hypothetical protein